MKTLQILVWLAFLSLLVPPVIFIAHQWRLRTKNGIIKVVREHTVYWVISYVATLIYLLVRRGSMILGQQFENDTLDIVALIIFTLLSVATWRYYFIFKRIVKENSQNTP